MSNQIEKRLTKVYKKYIDSKDYKSALEVLEKLLSINPKDENYLNEKGIVLTNLGEHTKAIDHFNNSFGENSNNAHMWNNKGLAHCNLHEFDNAINCFGKSYGIEGHEYTNALNNEGLAYYKGKKEKNKPLKEENFKNAINRFNKVIEQKKIKGL